ncbi:CKLF-like MARVEL transmembrane domain-containing protein 3 [Spea bombifrons]|uniref:CKLF-like MARVEL transmembrane domain-containing protein 3 n=1 Tax=Spea bombifrons TaxID=233779 RepID=UPI00234A1339|nr:CKLF-like MARVEL transmembrane domain-containing protein 3 [Spea bombifrons]
MAASSSRSDVIKELLVRLVSFAGVSCSGLSVSIVSIESLMAGSLTFLYVTKLHQKFSWPTMVVSFLTFICYVASTAVALMTVPLIEFHWARFTFFAYSTKLNEQMKGLLWPLLVLGFIATIFFAFDFYLIFNDLTKFLEKEEPTGETEAQKSDDEEFDSDSD